MKAKIKILIMLVAIAASVSMALAQYSGGSFDGYISLRSDDILYEGTSPVTTGAELPDIVHNLTINNPGGVTLSKSITVNGLLSVLSGDLNLNGHIITMGENATLQETPGNIIIGGGGSIKATRTLNDLANGQNVGNLGLLIKTVVPLGETTIARGNEPQELTPDKQSATRFFDVTPTHDTNLNATIDFYYDPSELNGTPEEDLALFISHDAPLQGLPSSLHKTMAASWQYLGGTVNNSANTICKGGIGGFSRLTIARGFVLLADERIKIEGNKISEGDIHSNGKIIFDKGEPGKHTGTLTAVGDITIEKNNAIIGNVFAGNDLFLFDYATVSGDAQEKATVAVLGLPTPAFIAGGNDVKVPKKESMTLSPGFYDEVEVKRGGTLFLTAGDYFINELDTDKGAVLSIDVSGGMVNINVVKRIDLAERVEIVITPLGQAGSNQVTFTTLQDKKMVIGEESLILGSFMAPNAHVKISEECGFRGSIVAKSITVEDEVTFVPHSSSISLPKPQPLPTEETANEENATVVADYQLAQNYPNPFNPATTIRFNLKEVGVVQLLVYNLQGQAVRTLLSSQMNPGQHAVVWNGTDERGQMVPSGIYLYKLRVNGFEETRKMTLMK